MKNIKVMKNSELEVVVGGSLKRAYPQLLGPDGMIGSGGEGAPIDHGYYHPQH
ncbi:MAG: hypothetical protein ACI319_09195 [Holdemanella porci]